MPAFHQPPLNIVVVVALWAGALAAAIASGRAGRAASRPRPSRARPPRAAYRERPLPVVRGIRAVVIGVGLGCLGAWALFAHAWLLIFALAFLAEEILETGIMALALRRRPRPGDAAKPEGCGPRGLHGQEKRG